METGVTPRSEFYTNEELQAMLDGTDLFAGNYTQEYKDRIRATLNGTKGPLLRGGRFNEDE